MQSYKIAFVGAPASGKTTLSARIFAEMLERGASSTGYVQEYAREYISAGFPLTKFIHQKEITEKQLAREQVAISNNFQYILCDSALWLGSVYQQHRGMTEEEKNKEIMYKIINDYNALGETFLHSYDMTIYTPLFDNKDHTNNQRVHNSLESLEIDKIIRNRLKMVKNVVYSPKDLAYRPAFVKYIVDQILNGLDKDDSE